MNGCACERDAIPCMACVLAESELRLKRLPEPRVVFGLVTGPRISVATTRADLAVRWKAAGYDVTETTADAMFPALADIVKSDAAGGETETWANAWLERQSVPVFVRQPADGTEQSVVTRLEQGTVPSALVADALAVAMRDASESNDALKSRAWRSVTALQSHMMKDGARKVLAGGRALQSVLNRFAADQQLTPGELAMILSASVHSVLLALPGMTAELARAIAVELANGPRK